jgi:carbon-monoxide dehydrogenase medium subunit
VSGAVLTPDSAEEAVQLLGEAGDRGAPLAGGTWIMRGDRSKDVYIALAGLPELTGVSMNGGLRAGALATHTELSLLDGPLAVLGEAAGRSAFPAVRNVATLGGNLGARPFPEADLVPALLAAEAHVGVAAPGGESRLGVAEYLVRRGVPGELVVDVTAPAPDGRRSAYERLTVRGGGEYAIASVALSVDLDADGAVRGARLALGGVEELARLSEPGAAELVGGQLDAEAGERAGRAAAAESTPREGLDAPGWYRAAVLPALVRRAVERIASPAAPGANGSGEWSRWR